MCKYKYTRIWKINYKIVVADSLEDAIAVYRHWNNNLPISEHEDITNIEAIGDDQIPQSFEVLMKI